ncbi:thermonuclease family protein [Streptomyces coeruleoprunus]|uniref:Thermonuclease family protein n=1 Tax=Streptomyces coeruleoprunus TaxID=285563 RepID=A0ABV9XHC1_9ACTN
MTPPHHDPAASRRGTADQPRGTPPRRRSWLIAALVSLGLIGGAGAIGLLADPEPAERTSAPAQPQSPPPQPPPARTSSSPPPTTSSARQPAAPAPAAELVVVRIVDGDTLDVRGDGRVLPGDTTARVRLIAVDAPEAGACHGAEATARLAALLPPGSALRAERDVDLKDPYDRYLLYVWNDKNVFVNESLVRTGHAEAVLFPPNDARWAALSKAEAVAREADAGLWSACAAPAAPPAVPSEPEPVPGNPAGLPPGPAPGPDLDCGDLDGPVWVGSYDPHRLDRDGDGVGCESG